MSEAPPKKLPPYYTEVGYALDRKTGLFHRSYQKRDGTMAHEVVVEATRFHGNRHENMRRAGLRFTGYKWEKI